jgi:hypothetical protein
MIVAAFLVILGVPFVAAACVDGIRMPRLAKAGVIASVPAAAAIMLRSPLDLAEVGLPIMALLVVLAWLFGFATGPVVRAIFQSAIRFARPF